MEEPIIELTLDELAKIALGTPRLNSVNISILHSLIDLLLKKLNCQNEQVTIGGLESRYMTRLLEISKKAPITFNDEKLVIVSNKIDKLLQIEERLNTATAKLENHFEEISKAHSADAHLYHYNIWAKYGSPTEDLCTISEPQNEVACKLIQNTDFIKKLLRRLAVPMVERMQEYETKMAELHAELLRFIEEARVQYQKISLVDGCIYEIEFLRKEIEKNHATFLSTVDEIQDMMDAKLSKMHLPALKKFIKDNITRLTLAIRTLQATNECPRAAGIIMTNATCLSCGGGKIRPCPIAEAVNEKPTKATPKKQSCGCDQWLVTKELTLQERMQRVKNTISEVETVKVERKLGYINSGIILFDGSDANRIS